MTQRMITKMMEPLKRRVFNMVVRGVVQLINDAGGLQVIQSTLLADETRDGIERLQQYGFSSHPNPGAEAFAVAMNGNRDHMVITNIDDRRYRIRDLEVGDVAIYNSHDPQPSLIMRASDGKIEIYSPDNIIINSDETIRLSGKEIEIHASDKYKFDVGGRGFDFYPTFTDTWDDCAVPGASNGCSPPEHPPAPAS